MSPEDEAQLRRLAFQEAYRRHQKASDADGFGASAGHAGRFHECAHEDCVLVRASAPSVVEPAMWPQWTQGRCRECGMPENSIVHRKPESAADWTWTHVFVPLPSPPAVEGQEPQ